MDVSLNADLKNLVGAKVKTDFNHELGRRLDALDRSIFITASDARNRLARKSKQRQQDCASIFLPQDTPTRHL